MGCLNVKVPFLRFNLSVSFYQNTISRSRRNFSKVREKSGKIKVKKVATLTKN